LAAIYTRVSTNRQEEEGTSLDTQAAACRTYAAEHGYTVDESHVYAEAFTGAELWDRPKLTELRQMIRSKRISHVVCYAIDRLSRDPVHLGVVLSEAEHAGVSVEFVTEPLDDSPEGQLIRFVRGYAAKVEHMKIRERSIRGKRARVQSGKIHNHGSELYGYRRDKGRGTREIVDEEADVVRRIYAAVAGGESIRGLARILNNEGIASPGAGKLAFKDGRTPRWGHGVLHRILTNPAYKGDTIAWRYRHRDKTNPQDLRPESEWIHLPLGTTPSIVDADIWEAAKRRLETNRGENARNTTRPYLLRGHVFCSVCGCRMYACPERGKGFYRCSSRERPQGACGGKRVPADLIEGEIWRVIADALSRPEVITAELERRESDGVGAWLVAERDRVSKALRKAETAQERLIREMSDGGAVALEIFRKELARREAEKQRHVATIADLDQRLLVRDIDSLNLGAVANYCERVRDNLGELNFDTKRLALQALNVKVFASGTSPDRWTVRGSIPFAAGDASQSC
jgi:site-specific DNA recombinase